MGPVNEAVQNGRRVLSHVVEMARTRLGLLALDVEEERARFTRLLLMGGMTLIFSACALLLIILLVVIAFWDTHRFLAIGGLLATFLALALGFGYQIWRYISNAPPPFASTLQELVRDKDSLTGEE